LKSIYAHNNCRQHSRNPPRQVGACPRICVGLVDLRNLTLCNLAATTLKAHTHPYISLLCRTIMLRNLMLLALLASTGADYTCGSPSKGKGGLAWCVSDTSNW
jgi:hypothetical protein